MTVPRGETPKSPPSAPEPEDRTSANAPRLPLRRKLVALIVALTLGPIPALGWLLMNEAKAGLEAQAKAFQLALAGDVTGSLEDQLTDAEDALDTIGRLLMSDRIPEEHAIEASLRTIEGVRALDHAVIYDDDGAFVDTVRQTSATPPQPPETLDEALRSEAERSGVALGGATPGDVAARLWVVVPLRPGPLEPITGFAASHVSLAPLQDHIETLANDRFEGRTRRLYVLDPNRRVVAAGDGMEGVAIDVLQHPLVDGIQRSEFREAFAQQHVYESRGTEFLGTLASVPARGWAIIVQVPTEEAFAPVRTMRNAIVASCVVILLFALGAGLMFARSVTRPVKALMTLARKLGKRELGATVEIDTRDELRTLGDALSQASLDLAAGEERAREEQEIRSDLGRYLPIELVERVVERRQDMALGGTRREITVLFADVVNFTPLAESREPEVVVGLLNELFTFLTEIVFRHEGTIDKFIGDCVMAMWNAPADQPDHAERALAAAEDMLRWLESANAHWQQEHGVQLQLAIGVHTGSALVGNVGSESRMAYTAIGDVVNVAARLEAIARPQQVLVTAATRDAAGDVYEYLDAGERELAGRRDTVHLFEVRV